MLGSSLRITSILGRTANSQAHPLESNSMRACDMRRRCFRSRLRAVIRTLTRRELLMKPKACAVAFVAMAGTLCAASVFAEESATAPSSKDTSALRVVVDPETGEVRAPTAEELNKQLARESA